MPKNILVRNINDEDAEWIADTVPPGMTQESYVASLIANARIASEASPVKPARRKRKTEFTFIDLFAGIGGFHMGLASNKGECVFANEWDKYAAQTYKTWTGHTEVNQEDIRTLNYAEEIPDHDILCGGFPCQPFSIAGVSKKNSLGRAHGFDDERQGNLFFAICGIVEAKKPPILILENVKNLKSHDKGNTFKVISQMLDDLGYEMKSQIIDAQGWVPQHRERIFLVCFNREQFTTDEIESFKFPEKPSNGPRLSSILETKAPDEKYMLTDNLWLYLQNYAAKHRAAGNGFGFGLVDGNDIARTMSARYYKDGSEILIKQNGFRNPRRLTPAEAAKLMGFNSKFAKLMGFKEVFPHIVSDTQSYKQFGNSVSPLVTEVVSKEAVKVLKKMRARTNPVGKAS
jgi:DNA (cytosine-5)-methyltransferase 1